ncbi:MAG TPA: NAD(P)H-hydrate epimerase, partial [Gammaproteobacteria bacterium]|nr:NAD(P)H-hydrate epimerase [Gammaproteobacteria bacterium]
MSLALYTAEETRALDRAAMDAGIPGRVLMERAGEAVVAAMARRWSLSPGLRVAVLVGGGNNGGDGYVVARRLRECGVTADLIALAPVERLSGEAAEAASHWQDAGGILLPPETDLAGYDVLVDALLGIGLRSAVRSPFREVIERMQSAAA